MQINFKSQYHNTNNKKTLYSSLRFRYCIFSRDIIFTEYKNVIFNRTLNSCLAINYSNIMIFYSYVTKSLI